MFERPYTLALAALTLLAGCGDTVLITNNMEGFDTINSAYIADVHLHNGGEEYAHMQQIVFSNIPNLEPYLPDVYRAYSYWLIDKDNMTPQEACRIYGETFADLAERLEPIAKPGNTILFVLQNHEDPAAPVQAGTYQGSEEFATLGITFFDNSLAAIGNSWNLDACLAHYGGDQGSQGSEDTPTPTFGPTPSPTPSHTPEPTPTPDPTPSFPPIFDQDAADEARVFWLSQEDTQTLMEVSPSSVGLDIFLKEHPVLRLNSEFDTLGEGEIVDARFTAIPVTVSATL